jgi:hypothetical protein
MNRLNCIIFFIHFSLFIVPNQLRCQQEDITVVQVDSAWAGNSVNAVIFRKNSIATHRDTQFIAYYNQDHYMVIGKRKLGESKWILKTTLFKGNAYDAHNMISIMADGDGYLHVSWDHHGNALNYCKSLAPGSLEFSGKISMTGQHEKNVTYPEFHRMPSGNLIFLYRDGESGRGNLVMNEYDLTSKKWQPLQINLVDGEGHRNAYWQACVDSKGRIHLSWVWRETPDVASNHDMAYARSDDGGKTWMSSAGKVYELPIRAASAEYAWKIPEHSGLINQSSMVADDDGHPYIATYFNLPGDTVTQYHIIYHTGKEWQRQSPGFRKTAFLLGGHGTKRIPMSRPQIIAWKYAGQIQLAVIFRDEERGAKVSVAICDNLSTGNWKIKDLTQHSVGSWEPTYDTELWKEKNVLHLFVQKVEQVDGEGRANIPPQPVQVLQWNPLKSKR